MPAKLMSNLFMLTLILGTTTGFAQEKPKPADKVVTIEKTQGGAIVRIGSEDLIRLHAGKDLPKPFFSPLLSPGGAAMTALTPKDHRHHAGLWISLEHVNGNNFWGAKYQQMDRVEPVPAKERIENLELKILEGSGPSRTLQLVNAWQGEGGKPVLRETTQITFYPDRLIVYDISLTVGGEPVTLDDTKEGFLGVRVAESMKEKNGGLITNCRGEKTEKECWGKTAEWTDYTGFVRSGQEQVGIALFDHPKNFRPSRYHARGYGLFTISPFGEKAYTNGAQPAAPVTLAPNETLRLRYGVYSHSGDAVAGKVAEAYQQFLKVAPE